MVLFVLGAGATRGASFVEEKNADGTPKRFCRPPLNGDFFTQLQRIRSEKHDQLVSQVIADVVELFGVNFRGDMETVFTTLEHTIRMVGATRENRRFSQEELRKKRNRLLQAIAAVLEESICDGANAAPCRFHDTLVSNMANHDAVITFNYDCTMDYALKTCGMGKWEPHYGYCLPIGQGQRTIPGEDGWRPVGQERLAKANTIRLLKLHGSLNFDVTEKYKRDGTIRERSVKLKTRPYTNQGRPLRFTIIPPESAKAYDLGIFQSLWRQAGREIHRAKSIVVVGYSFPPTDLHSSALFRVNVPNNLRSIAVVNRDPDARRRAREILRAGISPHTRVFSFETLEEFAPIPRSVWRRSDTSEEARAEQSTN